MDKPESARVVSEPALSELPASLGPDTALVFFKLVGIGQQAYTFIAGREKTARKMMADQPNFYIFSSKQDLRDALHAYVDRFCDAQGE